MRHDSAVPADRTVRAGLQTIAGFVTSSAYGHFVGQSLALAYVDRDALAADLTVDVIGEPCPVTVLKEPIYDPTGHRMRM